MHAGRPADRRGLARVAEEVLGRSGDVLEDEPERFVWRESHGVGRTTVTVSGDGAGEVSIVADRAGHYLVHWFLGLLGSPVLLARPFWARSDRATRETLDELAMELLRVADEAVPES
jgi:hypothetical protein